MYLKPLITEKSLKAVEGVNGYMFEVGKLLTKTQAKELIEKTFNVKVLSVNTKPHRAKVKRSGRRGLTVKGVDTKQIIVRLDKKDKISLFELKEGGK